MKKYLNYFENDIEKFVEYNLRDVEILVKLDEKLDFINLARGVCHLGHVPYDDVFFPSRYIEGAMLVYMKKLGVIAPNKKLRNINFDNDDYKKYTGAFVKEPIPGRYESFPGKYDSSPVHQSLMISWNELIGP